MSKLEEAEKMLSAMSDAEKSELMASIARDLGQTFAGIEAKVGVCGGEPCVAGTRIPVWLLEQARRLGTSEAELLRSYPTLRAADLVNAWNFVGAHLAEIDEQIRENEDAELMARFYANENFPLAVVEALRSMGHDAITVSETGKSGISWPDEDVLEFATQDDRILLSLNRKHFIRLHGENLEHAGIVVCTFGPDFSAQALRIHAEVSNYADARGQLLRVYRPSR